MKSRFLLVLISVLFVAGSGYGLIQANKYSQISVSNSKNTQSSLSAPENIKEELKSPEEEEEDFTYSY